ncbi:MAG: RNase adaptor protein RapZ, partial [Elusimicrobiota bacterium]|nr:RNase adaptor protein RapZ [Elusimicrobiota bacterium]
TMGELKNVIARLAGIAIEKKRINISVISFGYKYGLPLDADIVYDVRFLANPNYIDSLKSKTGKDAAVKNYILANSDFENFFSLFSKLIEYTLPKFISEGKSYLTIAIGCTGGRHRSVFAAERLADFLMKGKFKININHRDILRSKQ